MMNPVHARRHDYQVQNPLEVYRQSPVGMMKECRGLKRDEKHDQHGWTDAKDGHREGKKADGKNHFAKVESCSGRHVEIQISVMHVMKSPEDWDHVVGPMPPPIGVIQQQERRDGSDPKRKSNPV